jgi:hypothetical protein
MGVSTAREEAEVPDLGRGDLLFQTDGICAQRGLRMSTGAPLRRNVAREIVKGN